jgi:hypothetical protein
MVMKCGIMWREFSELSKSVFVHVATDEFSIRGRPTNVSRASLLTGISRKEVKRQHELLAVHVSVFSVPIFTQFEVHGTVNNLNVENFTFSIGT